MRSNVRWSRDLEAFEMRCPDCAAAGRQSFWPLTPEFWDKHNLQRCRACDRARKARAIAERRRNDPEYRARCLAEVRELKRVKGHIYRERSAA